MKLVLIRHAHSTSNEAGLLSGRLPGVHLSKKGVQQAEELAHRLGDFPILELRSSPMERCFETISPWLNSVVLQKSPKFKPILDEALNEVDYGSWSGKKLSSLSRKKEWKVVQESPSRMYFPEGESISQMQVRAMKSVHELAALPQSSTAVVVSHGDVIKAIVASALGVHLDEFQRLVIDPASISVLEFAGIKPRALIINDTRAVLTDLLAAPKRSRNLLGGGSGK